MKKQKRTSSGWAGWLAACHVGDRSKNPELQGTYASQDWFEGFDDFMRMSPMEQRMENPDAYDKRTRRQA